MNDDSTTQTVSYGRRAASYWSVDGLPEILRGLVLVILGGVASFWRVYEPESRIGFYFLIIFGGLALYFFLLERVVLDFLKSRITYPRTGYVQPPEELWGRRRASELVPLSLRPAPPYLLSCFSPSAEENVTFFWPRTVRPLMGFAALCLFGRDLLGPWLVPLAMPALAVTLYVANRRSERPCPWWSALILALSGPVFLRVNIPVPLQLTLPFLLAGAWILAQGVYTLVHYLHTNPYPQTAEGVKA
jgi:hypothetical protein